ncbi:hypothetical protein [Mesonia sp. K7]|uniref:hypothetical protein n=1 Tax=Mesonia sp. K7 TaxID=2218606 RepID=UPI000DA97D88|nr:hypothetical protein [Mesonia sp. K7]PZD78534.1 hypothetical protein DNG35_05590 [Mesonia sp. K7]
MVRIINYKQRQAEDGREFFVLEVAGGIEMVQSKESGQFYATSKKANIPSTFDEETCKALIGTELPGHIFKQEVEPYPYIVKETGEEIILSHKWIYEPEEPKRAIQETKFSKNGSLEELMEQAV